MQERNLPSSLLISRRWPIRDSQKNSQLFDAPIKHAQDRENSVLNSKRERESRRHHYCVCGSKFIAVSGSETPHSQRFEEGIGWEASTDVARPIARTSFAAVVLGQNESRSPDGHILLIRVVIGFS